MIKYVPQDTQVVFAEIPDEITLAINLSNCPHHCPGCHSQYLQTDCGEELTESVLDKLISQNSGVTCILFMGGDGDKKRLRQLASYIRATQIYKTAWYTGETIDKIDLSEYGHFFDYIKVGPYIQELGPLNNPKTNQRMYDIKTSIYGVIEIKDITNKFWKYDND